MLATIRYIIAYETQFLYFLVQKKLSHHSKDKENKDIPSKSSKSRPKSALEASSNKTPVLNQRPQSATQSSARSQGSQGSHSEAIPDTSRTGSSTNR